MESVEFSKMLVSTHNTAWCHNTEGHNLNNHCREKLKTYKMAFYSCKKVRYCKMCSSSFWGMLSLCCTFFMIPAEVPLQTEIWFDIPLIWATAGPMASNPGTSLQSCLSSRWLRQLDFWQYTCYMDYSIHRCNTVFSGTRCFWATWCLSFQGRIFF